jgi:hypothetical protein
MPDIKIFLKCSGTVNDVGGVARLHKTTPVVVDQSSEETSVNVTAIDSATPSTAIADAIWNASTASYGSSGTYGKLLEDTLTASFIATSVWNAATASYGSAGSYGLLIETDLDATISSRAATGAAMALTAAAVDAIWDEALSGHATVGTAGLELSSVYANLSPGKTFYVSKTGNDANDGLSWGTAKLTVGAAAAALLAVGYGTLYIGPGVYDEHIAMDCTSAQTGPISIIGCAFAEIVSTSNSESHSPLYLHHSTKGLLLENLRLRVASTATTVWAALKMISNRNVILRRVLMEMEQTSSTTSVIDPLYMESCTEVVVEGCLAKSVFYDAGNFSYCDRILVKDSTFISLFPDVGLENRSSALVLTSSSVIFDNTVFFIDRTSAGPATSIWLENITGYGASSIIFNNCSFLARTTGSNEHGTSIAVGVYFNYEFAYGTLDPAYVTFNGCHFYTSSANGDAHDLYIITSAAADAIHCALSGGTYDPDKITIAEVPDTDPGDVLINYTAKTGDSMALTAAAVDTVWDEAQSGHSTAGTFGKYLDAAITGRAAAGDAMTLTAAAVDAIWDESQSGHTSAGTFGKYLDSQVSLAGGGASAASIADAVWDEARTGHTTAGTFGYYVDASISAIPGTGDGSVSVDHDYGSTDALAYKTSGGVGINNASVRAYLTTDYDAGNRSSAYVKGTTTTDVNGRWETPLLLDPGAYTLEFCLQGYYGPDTQEVTVT